MMCSPWGTPLCCADTRRRSSAPGRSGKTGKRWLGGETSSSRCGCLWCFTLRFSVSFSALKMSLLDRHAFFSVCACVCVCVFATGPDTLREAGLRSRSGEVEEAVELGRGKWRRQIRIPAAAASAYSCTVLYVITRQCQSDTKSSINGMESTTHQKHLPE